MNNLLNLTREVCFSFVDAEGNLYDMPVGNIKRRNLDTKHIDFLKKYIHFVMNSKVVSDTTKVYIRSAGSSVAGVFKTYNMGMPEPEQVNIKTAQAKIDYDRKKLLKYFPEDMLAKVIYYGTADMKDYEKRLNLAISQYGSKNKLLDNLLLKIPKAAIQDTLSDEEFNDFISIIAPYSRRHMQYIENNLPINAAGYINYLLSTPNLAGEQLARQKILKELLE